MRDAIRANRDRLIDLDSQMGDGDLGLSMGDGFTAAAITAEEFPGDDCGKLLYAVGKAFNNAAPSSMGTLLSAGWMRAGKALKGKTNLTPGDIADLCAALLAGVVDLGKAKPGDKTFVDGFGPGVDALKAALARGEDLCAATLQAAEAAKKGFESTRGMVAAFGRAAIRGEDSRNEFDAGAAVAAVMFEALAKTI